MIAPTRSDRFREYKRQALVERRASPRQSVASGPDYVRMAEEIIAPGKAPEALTRDEQREAVAMAKALLIDMGIWPVKAGKNAA